MVGGLFHLTLRADKVAEAKAYFGDAAARIEREEPGTLAIVWFAMPSDPLAVAILEVYADRAALDAHNAKPALAALKAKAPDFVDMTTFRGISLAEPGIGYVQLAPISGPFVGATRTLSAAPGLDDQLRAATHDSTALVDVYFHSKTHVIGLEIFRDTAARDAALARDTKLGGEVETTGASILGFVR